MTTNNTHTVSEMTAETGVWADKMVSAERPDRDAPTSRRAYPLTGYSREGLDVKSTQIRHALAHPKAVS